MQKSGLFITLYDEDTLNLYLAKGIYGFLMPPVYGEVGLRSRHYHALADYACTREGTHVFFFLKRKIMYGGQAVGSKEYGAFYLNGRHSPLGRRANANVYWDESAREKYQATGKPGVFVVPQVGERCQPYLTRFRDTLGLKGQAISSDQLYWELGRYPYPLPSNTIAGMGFCTLTPGETEIALSLLRSNATSSYSGQSSEVISLKGDPIPFDPEYGISNVREALAKSPFVNEAHLEALVLANPHLLPAEVQPSADAAICRQVPMSPFKPFQMDRANIAYYSKPLVRDGTIPNAIIELKIKRAGKRDVEQALRYLRWLHIVLDKQAAQVNIYLCSPSFAKGIERHIPSEYRYQLNLVEL